MLRPATGVMAFCAAAGLAISLGSPVRVTARDAAPEAGRKPVLIELFTSEGCSTCPPADALLQKLLAQQPVGGAEIIALEEHVDYWNHLGWADPYSSADWTQRQSAYAAKFGNAEYTPELVVDGRSNFLGSDAEEAEQEIEKAALRKQTEIVVTPEPSKGNGAKSYSISVAKIADYQPGDTAEVWLAVTEDGLRSSVNAGENAGHTLDHVATLRSLKKIGVADPKAATVSYAGSSKLKLDRHWNAEKSRVVVFVQGSKSREILGVASIPL
ncbi:MAG: DUF1223 domain-containing protein [Candidatus Sulfotelmatobacter sp.]|jgi:hypothetical protein